LQDTLDVEHIFSATPFNGDGVITTASADDEETKDALNDIMTCLGSEMDRSKVPGVSQPLVDKFFADAAAVVAWYNEGDSSRPPPMRLDHGVEAQAHMLEGVRHKLNDYFARVSLAGVNPRAADALNPPLSAYETMSKDMLKSDDAAIAALPLALIEAGKPLNLTASVNPAWSAQMTRFRDEIVTPLLAASWQLTEGQWEEIKKKFGDYAAWQQRKPQTPVAQLGISRLEALLAPQVKERIDELIA